MSWLKGLLRRRIPTRYRTWYRVRFNTEWTAGGGYGRYGTALPPVQEALASHRATGSVAWLERSDDLGKTWTRCGDDGKPEGA